LADAYQESAKSNEEVNLRRVPGGAIISKNHNVPGCGIRKNKKFKKPETKSETYEEIKE